MIKVLNLYAGIGGNRKLWPNDKIEVTAVELNPKIAKIYSDFFPQDKIIIADAHKYLLEHYKEFDFIWSSPPCPSHGVSRFWSTKGKKFSENYPGPIYPDMKLYEEIIFLKHFFKGKWVIENVISYYEPLIKPYKYKNHFYWSNFIIDGKTKIFRHHDSRISELQKFKGNFDLSKYKGIDKKKVLRNCVEPQSGLYIFDCAFNEKQVVLNVF